jgi:cytochrome c553
MNPADPDKQTQLVRAYQRYRSGELGADQLPDLADVFPDDPQVRAEIGLSVEPNAAPVQALITACCQCHNDVLDQSLSRARFNVALSRMSRDELELAIERIQRMPNELGVMPPVESRQLTDAVRARLIEYLRLSARSAEDDALLDQAAALGMAKERWPGMRYN